MLTDQQIEAAARKLCELRGWEPESETVFTERAPHSPTYRVSSTHLKDCIREIRAADQVREAIAFATTVQVPATEPPPFCPPPGPCECGHSHAAHLNFAEFSTCRECLCPEYWTRNAEFSAPQSRG